MIKRQGFLMIDVLLALMLFIISFPFIAMAFHQTQTNLWYAYDLNEALWLAQNSLESCQSSYRRFNGTEKIVKGSTVFIRQLTITESVSQPPLKEAVVLVSWQHGQFQGCCELRTLVLP